MQVVASDKPSVMFTYASPRGEHGSVVGVTQNVDKYVYGIAFFENVYGTWWRKPYTENKVLQLVQYMSYDSSFQIIDYWTGGIDGYADYFAAFVVPYTYKDTIPDPNGSWKLPDEIYSNSIAYTILDRRTPSDFISFAGYTWEKKVTNDENNNGKWGPGNNHFNTNSILVDNEGKLHIAVSFNYGIHGTWNCSELIMTNQLGYGLYRVKVDSNVSNLPPNIVLGLLFTWSDDPAYAHREIDVEHSKGDVVGEGTSNDWQNVIQPYGIPENRMRFSAPTNMNNSVHEFLWMSNAVWFCNFKDYTNNITNYRVIGANNLKFTNSSQLATGQIRSVTNTSIIVNYPGGIQKTGFYKTVTDSMSGFPNPFYTHTFSNNIPPTGDEKVHINIWLSSNLPDGYVEQKYEVIISDFEFIPIDRISPQLEILNVKSNFLTLKLNSQGN